MKPTEVLMQEHRVIELVLSCLDRMADNCDAGLPLDIEAATQAIDFFRVFADKCHHGKEEDLLFPLMEAKGFPRDGGPTGVMLHEHELGRRQVRSMEDAVKETSLGDLAGKILFVEQALRVLGAVAAAHSEGRPLPVHDGRPGPLARRPGRAGGGVRQGRVRVDRPRGA